MGIPKFYRWLSERYPLLNMSVAATEAPPEMDNLYLDMNGIIHNCTHANDPNLKLTETEMVVRIFTYLDKLIQIIKPQKLVFMAIDGVAPRAKMNQQRARRFKSAKEREAREAEMRAKGEEIDPATAFDSNCITPGTPFMDRLGRHLRFFIRRKMAEDPVWQKPNVIFSGHEVPGEGEHKIMEYIRWQKLQPGYPPNQRHCMYGLDADLIMLSLVTHEPHFCLLREVVSFSGRGRGQPSRETLENPCAENFILFQIGLLREYFEVEFGLLPPLPWSPDGTVDLERIVDDFVLFCMLVGNDFLPALPTMDIAEGGLNKLIQMYKDMLPELGGYLTDAGDLHHGRLEVMLGKLADLEMETLQERAEDTEWFENKRARRGGGGRGNGDGTGGSLGGGGPAVALAALGVSLLDPLTGVALEEEEEEEEAKPQEPTMMSKEARAMFLAGEGTAALDAWKTRYYREKLEMPDDQRRAVSEQYICGLHWVLQYYYRGVASWDWFYPYHYAPMASELRDLGGIQVSFTPGKPFLPYEQLLAVQPPASCTLLPAAYHYLMTSDTSPIRDFYPIKFEIDMEGKRAEWEGIVKIPFISESRLLEAARSVKPEQLTADERRRNSHGDVLIFQHTPGRHEAEHCESTLPRWGATVHHAHSSCRHVPPPPPLPPAQLGFRPALVKGTGVGKKNPPGFPTLKTMKLLGAELKNAGVNVFGSASKKESLILQLPDIRSALGDSADASAVASMIGERVYVKWPYLQEAQITKVSDARQEITAGGVRPAAKEEADAWSTLSAQTHNLFLTKQGVETGALPVMLHVKACTGYLRHADGSIVKRYKTEEAPYPLQAVLRQRPRPPPGFHDPDEPRALDFDEGARILFLGQEHYGCSGTVMADPGRGLGADGKRLAGGAARACVRVQPPRHDAAGAIKRGRQVVKDYPIQYFPSGTAARTLRINPRLLGRITGNVWVGDGENRLDIGLAVKNAKQGVCVPGLAAPLPDETGWSYSQALLDTVGEYRRRFPWVFTALEGTGEGRITVESFVPPSVGATPGERSAKIGEVTSWLKGLPSAKRPLVKSGTLVASDRAIEVLMSTMPPSLPRGAGAPIPIDYENVAPPLLLGPYDPSRPLSTLLGGDMELGDRVVVVRGSGSPPFGSRGTVVAVYEDAVELMMDEEFAGGTTLNGRIRLPRGATVPKDQLLNVSKPQRVHMPSKQDLPRRMREPAAAPGTTSAAAAAAADATDDPDAGRPTALAVLAPWCKGRMPTRAQPRAIAPAPAPEPEPEAPPPAAAAAAGAAPPPPARLLPQAGGAPPRGGAQQHPKQQHAPQPAVQVPAPQLNWQQQLLQGGRGARPGGQPAAPGAAPQPVPAAPQQRQQQGRGRGAGPGIAVPLSVSPAQPPPPGSQLLRMLQQQRGAPGQPAPPPQPRPQHPQYSQGYGQPYGGAPPPPQQQPRQQLPYQNYEQQQPMPQQQLTWQQQQYYSHPGSQPVPPPPPPPGGPQAAGRSGGPAGQQRQAGAQGQALLSMLQTSGPAPEGGKDKKKKTKSKEASAPNGSAATPAAGGSAAAAADASAKKEKKKKKEQEGAAAGAAAAAPAEGKKAKDKTKKQKQGSSAEHLTAALTCTEGGGVKLSLSVDGAGTSAAAAAAAGAASGAAAAAAPAAASAKKRDRPGKKERAAAAATTSEPAPAAEAAASEAGGTHPVHLTLDVGTNGSVHAALSTDNAAAAAAGPSAEPKAPAAEASAPEDAPAAAAAAAAEPASPAKGGLLQRMTGFFSLGSKKKKEEKKDEKKGKKEEESKKQPEAKAPAATPFAAAAAEPAVAPAADAAAAAPVEASPQRSLSLKLMGGEGASAAAPAAAKKAPEAAPAAEAAPAVPVSTTGSVSPAPPASPLSASGRFSGTGRGGGRPVTPPKGKAVPKMPDGTKGFTLGRGRAAAGGAASPAAPGSMGGGAPVGSPFSAAPPAPAASGSGGGGNGGGGAILELLKAASLKKPEPQPAPAAAPNAGALLLSQLQGQLAAGAAQQQPGAAQQQGALSGLLLGGAPMQQPYGAAAQQQQMLLAQQQAAATAGGGGVLPALLLGGAPMQPAAPPPNPLQQLLSNAAANPGQPAAAASGAQLLMALQRGGGSGGAPEQRPPTF